MTHETKRQRLAVEPHLARDVDARRTAAGPINGAPAAAGVWRFLGHPVSPGWQRLVRTLARLLACRAPHGAHQTLAAALKTTYTCALLAPRRHCRPLAIVRASFFLARPQFAVHRHTGEIGRFQRVGAVWRQDRRV